MTINFLKSVFIISILFMLTSFDVPKGWHKAGSDPDKYEMGAANIPENSDSVWTVKSIAPEIKGFGTWMNNTPPDKYLGKRIRLTGFMKSKDVANWAGLWLRVDGKDVKQSLSFDNMSDRPIKGTTTWTKYKIVLDVPPNASNIAYGALLGGTGQIWFGNIKLKKVSKLVKTTGRKGNK